MQDQFDTPEKVAAVIRNAREQMQRDLTDKEYEGLTSALSFCYLHCPASQQALVMAQLAECESRRFYSKTKILAIQSARF